MRWVIQVKPDGVRVREDEIFEYKIFPITGGGGCSCRAFFLDAADSSVPSLGYP